jgi:hypothetical protein
MSYYFYCSLTQFTLHSREFTLYRALKIIMQDAKLSYSNRYRCVLFQFRLSEMAYFRYLLS